MAFLMLVNNNERLPKLLNLFVYKDFTHIVIEYFKFKPFIVLFWRYFVDFFQYFSSNWSQALHLWVITWAQRAERSRNIPSRYQTWQLPLQPRKKKRTYHRFRVGRNRPHIQVKTIEESPENGSRERPKTLIITKQAKNLPSSVRLPKNNRPQQNRHRDLHAPRVHPPP